MKATTALSATVLAILPSLTQAQLTNWAVNVGGNGHYYEAIRSPGGITWSNATSIASNRGGYLATITSSNENAFVFALVSQDTSFWYHSPFNTWWGPWLGGVQPAGSPEPAGGWQWLTGEPFTYSNWSPGQPNNSNGNENRIQFGGQTSIAGTWNDLSEASTTYARSFIIEYSNWPPGQPGGCADLVAPGTWTRWWTYDLTYRFFEMSDGQTYWIRPGALVRVHPDNAGQWDSIQEYVGAWAQLTNAPGTSWYSPGDTNLTFEIELPSLAVKTREAGDPSTNSGRIEMEVAAHAGRLAFLATFVGTPTVTNVPETPDTQAFLLASGPLSSARFCFSYDPPTSLGPPLAIHASPVPSPRVALSWNSVPGRLYQLQFCPDLSSGQWEDLEWPVSGAGATLGSVDLMGADIPQRFYRCVAFP